MLSLSASCCLDCCPFLLLKTTTVSQYSLKQPLSGLVLCLVSYPESPHSVETDAGVWVAAGDEGPANVSGQDVGNDSS
ncbi:UDP-N-acetylmuramate--L-alanine ligase [Dissostichus eleginoides]|uniref:UDP-N-acetylmuramate--L-alanine ligase n=1 Tax=Dissostichus eleginoides TaxID=100907 RepID=A0AAD9F0Q0_DISEL|nr:UDP-N-acetylmuramate--L-alanine ligase [Dissostichus eleginoides]